MRPLAVCCLLSPLFFTACYSVSSQSPHSRPGALHGSIAPAKSPIYCSEPSLRKKYRRSTDNERYSHQQENRFQETGTSPLSTFSIDVDTASYANTRRLINNKSSIPKGAVRVEEMINYFDYQYPNPQGDIPFAVAAEVAACPWKPKHKLVRIALQGKEIETSTRAPANLVFLIDVSGSMKQKNKLTLVQRSLIMLTNQMRQDDRIAIVTYAGSSGVALPSTPCSEREKIHDAIDSLSAAGSTAGSDGIQLAYQIAKQNYRRGGINRVFLATDGDFNVGPSSDSALVDLIEEKSKSGIYLSVLGFGMGNYNDSMLEKISGKGNGNYAYIDTQNEAQKAMIRQLSSNLVTIAKDVKIQVEFNPARVKSHRLIGYENRLLEDEDFADDKKDAGEIGAGHQVTAFYEIIPAGLPLSGEGSIPLKYRSSEPTLTPEADSGELMTVKIRYKKPDGRRSHELSYPIADSKQSFLNASSDYRFASAVAAFGMKLSDSAYAGGISKQKILTWAKPGTRNDPYGLRTEFTELVRKSM